MRSFKRDLVGSVVIGVATGTFLGFLAGNAEGATIAPAPQQTREWNHTPPPSTRPAPTFPGSVGNTPAPLPTRNYTPPVRPTAVPTFTRQADVKRLPARTSRCGR